jgi:hypothetical protein
VCKDKDSKMYYIQGCWSGGRIFGEWSVDEKSQAIKEAKDLVKDPSFEGDYVRVIYEGELVWDSRTE